MIVHKVDFLFMALSILGAGILFATPGLLEGDRSRPRWKAGLIRLIAALAMIVPGALVSHLFGSAGSWTALVKTAIALWLAPFLLAIVFHLQASPRSE